MKNILLIFTGGTICSFPETEGGKNQSDAGRAESYLEQNYKKSSSPFSGDIVFAPRYLEQDILSENMTVGSWNNLVDILKEPDIQKDFEGVIILHGTDTLAYTSALLSFILAGFRIPVCIVSAQLNLEHPKTNGYNNFRAAVELVLNGIAPNVYAVYQNLKNKDHDPGQMLVHYGAHLTQCKNFSNNFHSCDEMEISDISNAKLKGKPFETNARYIDKISHVAEGVLLIRPYTNMAYINFNLKGVSAIVHGTYHAQSVCIGRAKNPKKDKNSMLEFKDVCTSDRKYSILSLLSRCKKRNIPVFLAPCNGDGFSYGTTENALFCGARAMGDITLEAAYAKVILALSLGKTVDKLNEFLKESINYEFV